MHQSKTENILDIDCVFECLSDKGGIFISNYQTASNCSILKDHNIGAIISVARNAYIHERTANINYLYIPALDIESYCIDDHFEEAFDFIDRHRKQTNILVHCVSGVSRSVTIVAAYLVKKYRYSPKNVMGLLKRKRPKINPNKGFLSQLQTYSEKLGLAKGTYKSLDCKKSNKFRSHKPDCKNMIESLKVEVSDNPEKTPTFSFQKETKEQLQITQKLEELRHKVIKASYLKNRRRNKSKVQSELLRNSFKNSTELSSIGKVSFFMTKSLSIE